MSHPHDQRCLAFCTGSLMFPRQRCEATHYEEITTRFVITDLRGARNCHSRPPALCPGGGLTCAYTRGRAGDVREHQGLPSHLGRHRLSRSSTSATRQVSKGSDRSRWQGERGELSTLRRISPRRRRKARMDPVRYGQDLRVRAVHWRLNYLL